MKQWIVLGLVCLWGEGAAQSLSLTGSPLIGACPRTVTLSWVATGVANCVKLNAWSGAAPLMGSEARSIDMASIFTLACSEAGHVTLSWTAPVFNTDGTPLTDLAGYDLYHAATAAEVPGAIPSLLGVDTSTAVTGLPDGPRYFALKARNDAGARSALSTLANTTVAAVQITDSVTATCESVTDTVFPTVTITGPTLGTSYATSATPLTVSGSASDNIGVTEVTWTNDRGSLGSAAGTDSWSATVPLFSGANVLTIMASDAAGNASIDTLTVTYMSPVATPKTVGMEVYDLGSKGQIGRIVGHVPLDTPCGAFYLSQNGLAYYALPLSVVTLSLKPKPRGAILVGVCA